MAQCLEHDRGYKYWMSNGGCLWGSFLSLILWLCPPFSWDHRYVHMAVQSDEVLATPWFIFGKSHFNPLLLQSRRQWSIHYWPRRWSLYLQNQSSCFWINLILMTVVTAFLYSTMKASNVTLHWGTSSTAVVQVSGVCTWVYSQDTCMQHTGEM